MAKRLRPWLQKRLGKTKILYPSDYRSEDGGSGGGEALSPEDNITVNTESGYTLFDGFSNYLKWGDYLDSLFAANDTYFELECTIKDVPITGTQRLFSKVEFATNNRSFVLQKINGDINFIWFADGSATLSRGVTWANAITNTNAHRIVLKYDGAIDTNNGLDRVILEIDGVVAGSKTLTSNAGALGQIFNSTAQLAFGTDVNAAGTVQFTTAMFNGSAKNLVIRSSGGIVQLSGLNVTLATDTNMTIGTYNRIMQPIVNGTLNSLAQDTCQVTVNSFVDTGTQYNLYYMASNPNINSDRDVTCLATLTKGNVVSTGWSKRLSGGLPEIIYDVGAVGKFDAKQVWLRNVRKKDDGTYEAWPMGQSATDTFAMGYSTSPDGITWTRQNSGDSVYSDGATGLTCYHIILDPSDNKYRMVYSGGTLGLGVCVAESINGISWTKTNTNILFDESLGWPLAFKKFGSYYYIWFAKRLRFANGMSNDIVVFRTTNFTTFEYIGTQIRQSGGTEYATTSTIGLGQKSNGNWFMLHTLYKNQIGKSANLGEEFTQIKVAELNRSDLPIAGRMPTYTYPSYVIEHYPLNRDSNSGLNFTEVISGGSATINSTPVFTPDPLYGNRDLGFVALNGAQSITKSTVLPMTFDTGNFAVKFRIGIVTTATREILRIGDDVNNRGVLLTLEAGKFRVRLSADGTSWTKDYVTTVNLSKPTGMNYIDNHIYLSMSFSGGVLKMYNDFVEFTSGEITKTIDTAMTNIAYTNGTRVIGRNATLELRSVSILSGMTEQELIDLDL